MSDTFSFASRLCKFVILLVILLTDRASLYLWWLGQPYQDAMSIFVPLLTPMLALVLALDTFRAPVQTRCWALIRRLCIPVVLPYQF